ncbi:MAG TPA: HAD hydrolase-like protein [Verrucomicrobiae bacterium]|nr:HAD hydrolase-like protein [Verrucomicrobiae bacterium]
MIRLVLFDIDGTLIRTNGAGVKAFGLALETQFKIANGIHDVKFAGRTDTGVAREVFLRHGIEPSAENFQHFFDCYAHWLGHILTETRGEVCQGIGELILELESLPQPPVIGLLTGNIRLGAEIKLRHYRLWQFFRTGGFADDHEERDQIAVIARERGCRLLGEPLRDEQVIVIGDTPLDIQCGKAINARVLAVATGSSTVEELKAHRPDWVVKDLDGITVEDLCRL